MVDFDFFKAPQQSVDFSPIMEGSRLKAEAIRQAAAAIAEGIHRRRQNQLTQQHLALQAAEQKIQSQRLNELERHNQAMEEIGVTREANKPVIAGAHDETKKAVAEIGAGSREAVGAAHDAAALERTKTRIGADQAGGAAMEGALGAGGLTLPQGTGSAVGARHMGVLGNILTRMMQAKEKHEALKTAKDETSAATDQALEAGTITDQQAAGIKAQINAGNPAAGAAQLTHAATTQAGKDEAEMHREDTVKFLKKAAGEAGTSGNMKLRTELFADAAMLQNFHGPHLMDKAAELYAKAQGLGVTPKGEKIPEMALPTGKKVLDPVGFSAGGNFEEMTPEQKLYLTGVATEQAKGDGRYKALEAQEAAIPLESKDRDSQIGLIQNRKNAIIAEHGNTIAQFSGWHAGNAPAEPESKDSAKSILRDLAGKKIAPDEAKARAAALGYDSPDKLKEAASKEP